MGNSGDLLLHGQQIVWSQIETIVPDDPVFNCVDRFHCYMEPVSHHEVVARYGSICMEIVANLAKVNAGISESRGCRQRPHCEWLSRRKRMRNLIGKSGSQVVE